MNLAGKSQYKRTKIILYFILILLVCYFLFFRNSDSNLSGNVTIDRIKKIEIGMTEEQTVNILGQPYSIEPYNIQKNLGRRSFVMVYSKSVPGVMWYPMLWIHLENKLVTEVYAKRYGCWGFDDKGVYGLTKGKKWETESFKDTFPE
jgi:hypothetical protein